MKPERSEGTGENAAQHGGHAHEYESSTRAKETPQTEFGLPKDGALSRGSRASRAKGKPRTRIDGRRAEDSHDTRPAGLDDGGRDEGERLNELAREEASDGTPADAMGTSIEAERVPLEWSEADERVLKLLLGDERESIPNTLFEPREREDIRDRLQDLKVQLKGMQEMNVEQLEALTTTISEMREASERIGKKDWLLFAMGAVVAFAISAAFSPATVVFIAKLFVHEVAHLFGEGLAG
jgi:hypothetical protein